MTVTDLTNIVSRTASDSNTTPLATLPSSDSSPVGVAHAYLKTTPNAFGDMRQECEALYVEFAPLVRRLIRQYGQDAEMRQDLAGEIYYRFCMLLEAYDPQRGIPLRPYLVRQLTVAIYSYSRHYWRVKKREVAWNGADCGNAVPTMDPTSSWLSALSQRQCIATLWEATSQLPCRQRQVFLWRYYEERSFAEIAETLGIQPATARSLLRHAINNLRKHLRHMLDDNG